MAGMILHSDLNSFYASVEQLLQPELRGKAMAVGGSAEERHGIILARSRPAAAKGVRAGQAIWEARQLCPGLIVVPPRYEQYVKFSAMAREIYSRFTDRIEPFGMDECWLELQGSGDGVATAEKIRRTVRDELGLTVSVGVSFSKVFAKLGSDMKKPDAVTVITRENFRRRIWPLPVSELLYCGPATTRKLGNYGIRSIGQLAQSPPEFLKGLLGENGLTLWRYASGQEESRVTPVDYQAPVKSLGHGITCTADLETEYEVWLVLLSLAQDVGRRLRLHGLRAEGVQVSVRGKDLAYRQFQRKLHTATQNALELAQQGFALFREHYDPRGGVRALTIRAISLAREEAPSQLSIFEDPAALHRRRNLDRTVDRLRERFGMDIIRPAAVLQEHHMPDDGRDLVLMPGIMYE